MQNDDYMKAITAIKVNSTDYTNGFVWNNNCYSIAATDGSISLGGSAFTEENNTVTITADGYKELTAAITKDGKLVAGDNNSNGGDNSGESGSTGDATLKDCPSNLGFSYGTFYFDQGGSNTAAEPYLKSITKITLNDKELSPMDSSSWSLKTGEYNVKATSTDKYIEFYSRDFSESENTLVISADGYKDLKLKIAKSGKSIIQ